MNTAPGQEHSKEDELGSPTEELVNPQDSDQLSGYKSCLDRELEGLVCNPVAGCPQGIF